MLRFINRSAAHRLRLLTVAGLLPRDWELKLVDENVTVLEADLAWADYVFISAMAVQQEVRRIIAWCQRLAKRRWPAAPLTMSWEEYPEVDHRPGGSGGRYPPR